MIAFHVCISGWRQDYGNTSGMLNLSQKLIENCHFCNGHSRVWLFAWNNDWRMTAEHFWLVKQRYECEVRVGVYGYSWGGGWGAIKIAKELKKVGVRVRSMVLCDPVYRHPNPLLRWTALLKRQRMFFGSPIIHIPDNVDQVYSFHQTISRPQGHLLVADGDGTELHRPVQLEMDHLKISDAEEFHDLVLKVADKIRSECGTPACTQFPLCKKEAGR
jgi:hypothetical protein